MFRIVRLIQNETIKIFLRARVWIILLLLLIINLAMGLITHHVEELNINTALDFISLTVKIYPAIIIFTIVIASDIVSAEFSSGTIKLLLARPLKRWKILMSKYIAMLLFALFFSLVLFGFSCSIGYILWGNFESIIDPIAMGKILFFYFLRFIDLVMVVTLTFMLSTVFLSSTLAISISIILVVARMSIIVLLHALNLVNYFLYAHSDLTRYFDGSEPYNGTMLSFSITVIIFHFVLFHFISWYVFKKRDVSV